jgi:hypothetical protein
VSFRVVGVVLALASAVLFGSMGFGQTEAKSASAPHERTNGEATALRNALDALASFDSCLRSARRDLGRPSAADPRSLTQLDVTTNVASAHLAGCQNDELAAVAGSVSALRAAASWDVVHAATMAQADGQQAGLVLGQLILLVRHVDLTGGAGNLPRKTTEQWSTYARSFYGSVVRMGRRRHELRLALREASGGS